MLRKNPEKTQVIIELVDKEDTPKLVGLIQAAISKSVPGARVDVRQLQTNPWTIQSCFAEIARDEKVMAYGRPLIKIASGGKVQIDECEANCE